MLEIADLGKKKGFASAIAPSFAGCYDEATMKTNPRPDTAPCDATCSLDRRSFLRKSAGAGWALGWGSGALALAADAVKPASETLVTSFYKTLTDEQRKGICFPFEDKLRNQVENNWHITEHRLNTFYTKDQQEMIRQIFMGLHSEEYAGKVFGQVEHDSGNEGFFGGSSIAMFGEPGAGDFEFVLTGRHCTRRCDGNSVAGAAFGGPIFYGHAAEGSDETAEHPGNVYWYQAQRANAVYQMLDGKQREKALLIAGRNEEGMDTVKLTGKTEGIEGIRMTDLSADQKDEVRKVLRDILAPYRAEDVEESMKMIEAAGFENLHMAFYRKGDIGQDQVWDVWQIEGPSMVSYFRGSPHVHAWLHVREPA